MNFINHNYLHEATCGECFKDGTPRFAHGELWTNHQIDHDVICLDAIGVEALELVNDQALVGQLVLVPIVAFNVMLRSGCALNLVCGQANQRLFVQDDPTPEKNQIAARRGSCHQQCAEGQ